MKKILLILFLSLFLQKFVLAGITEQKKYICKTTGAGTIISIIENYDDTHFLVSENFGLGELVAFSKVQNNILQFFIVDPGFGVVIEGILSKSGSKLKYESENYVLDENIFNDLLKSPSKFGDAISKYPTLKLSNDELINEINNHKKIDEALTSSGRVSMGMGASYIC